MKKLSMFLTAASCTTLCAISVASATQAASVPMGYQMYNALGNSDTSVGLSIHRKPAFVGKVASVSGGNELVMQGTPGWTVDQFVYSAGVQPDTFYVIIASGNLEGRHFEVTANSANSLTLILGGEVIAPDVPVDTQIKLIAYWTLNTVFPEGEGVNPSTSHFVRNSEILTPFTDQPGINLATEFTYYYYSGVLNGGEGWRRVGGGLSTKFDDQVLSKDVPITIRHNVAIATELTNLGDVPTTDYRALLNRNLENSKQDNAVSGPVPLEVTLSGSELWESGAFEGSASHFARKDELLVFDHTSPVKNRSSSFTYYYYIGTLNGGPGWRRVGGGLSNIVGTDVVFSLDTSVVVRRASGAAGSAVWHMPLPYDPTAP